jgi:predicted metalloprotease with PDZ domain
MISKFHNGGSAVCPRALTGCLALGVAIAAMQAIADAQTISEKPAKKRDAAAAATEQTRPAAGSRPRRDANGKKRRAMTLGAELRAEKIPVLEVSSVEEGSAAARVGLQPQDRIISVDGAGVSNSRQLDAYLASQAGRHIPIVVERNGSHMTLMAMPDPIGGDAAWLGVFLDRGDPSAHGARITHIYPTGPAARAGLQVGDTITRFNDQAIDHPADLILLVQESEPQSEVALHVLRNEREQTIPMILGTRSHFIQRNDSQQGNGNDDSPGEFAHHDAESRPTSDGPYREDAFENVPPHLMRLESDRRNGEQHQRIEQEIRALREEFRQLKDELRQLREDSKEK